MQEQIREKQMAYRTQTHLLGTEENGTLADKVDKELQKILDDGSNYGWKLHSISHSLVSQAKPISSSLALCSHDNLDGYCRC